MKGRGQEEPSLELTMAFQFTFCWELSGVSQGTIANYYEASSYRAVAVQHFKIKKPAEKEKKLFRLLETLKTTYSQLKT